MGGTTLSLGKLRFTWKQLVAQETDIIEDQSLHWEVIWVVEATSDFTENHAVIVKFSVHFAMLYIEEEWFPIQRNPADIQKASFFCFQELPVSRILFPLPDLIFGGLLSIFGVSLTANLTAEFSLTYNQLSVLQMNWEWADRLWLRR